MSELTEQRVVTFRGSVLRVGNSIALGTGCCCPPGDPDLPPCHGAFSDCQVSSVVRQKCGYPAYDGGNERYLTRTTVREYHELWTQTRTFTNTAPPYAGDTTNDSLTEKNDYSRTETDATDRQTCAQADETCVSSLGHYSGSYTDSANPDSGCSESYDYDSCDLDSAQQRTCLFGFQFDGYTYSDDTGPADVATQTTLVQKSISTASKSTFEDSGQQTTQTEGAFSQSITTTITLSDEYTTAELVSDALSRLPAYTSLDCASFHASYALSDDELTVAATKGQYSLTVPANQRWEWDVIFTPTSGAGSSTHMVAATGVHTYEIIPDGSMQGVWSIGNLVCIPLPPPTP